MYPLLHEVRHTLEEPNRHLRNRPRRLPLWWLSAPLDALRLRRCRCTNIHCASIRYATITVKHYLKESYEYRRIEYYRAHPR